jgi:squalene-hopene/tetraprenyl-beta-curcumene cyclase
LKEANKDGRYDAILKNATAYLKKLQNSLAEDDVKFGGVGYDNKSRPDLSNTQYFIDALIAAGVPKDDPAIKRAMKFVSRCQNLPGETNDQSFAKKTSEDDKGGLVYVPILDPDDKRHTTPEGGLRSLGAMTYGGLRSFLYAGVSKDDPRVKGAVRWIRRHYTLDENPGMGQAGLFYYYHTFGKAMAALGEDRFEDAQGQKHDWRRELFEALKKRQQANGSFINKGDRQFGEADPNLATGFAMLALSYTKAPKK